jgi:hypothetical protein
MQMMAWAEMLHDYTQEKGLIVGVLETFDGEHPCAKCCKIAAVEKDEQKKKSLPLLKLDKLSKWFGLHPTEEALIQRRNFVPLVISFAEPDGFASSSSLAPPTPPPRDFS